MIYYFSATGNSQYVAQQVAAAIYEHCEAITDTPAQLALGEGEVLGLVVPTHNWGLPAIVCEWLQNLQGDIPSTAYCFLVATYGTTTGQIARQTDRFLRRYKGNPLDASFGVRMPDIWTPLFDLSDPQQVAHRVACAKQEVADLIPLIQQRTRGCHIPRAIPAPVALCGYALYDSKRKTKHLHAGDMCIGCGLCAKQCPVHAIRMENKRPVWVKEQCTMCLRCLHHCPKFAIQYDNRTAHHGQYTFQKYNRLCQ